MTSAIVKLFQEAVMSQEFQVMDSYPSKISASALSIYDLVAMNQPSLFIPNSELEKLLNAGLTGTSLYGLALRTRSKVVKELVCRSLGYPVPKSFKKTRPRFPGQDFDIYVQKSSNLQIWNEEITATRRYVLIRVTEEGLILGVRVIEGEALALLDTTGTLTQKYQARLGSISEPSELVSETDSARLSSLLKIPCDPLQQEKPSDVPVANTLMPIALLFSKLQPLIGQTFLHLGHDQERNRGGALHQMVCDALGYPAYSDNGQFPDVRHQLLEVKLQTSPTIDLGLVTPDSQEPLSGISLGGTPIRHCDVRYVIFHGSLEDKHVRLNGFILSTGEQFFTRFKRFEGKVVNKKIQINLPRNFFPCDAK